MKRDVWMPTQPAAGELGTGHESHGPARSPLLDARIMMIDDEPLMTALIEAHLEDAGYRNIIIGNDPRQALTMLRKHEPGVLLLDLMMPGLSGFDVLEAIRADRQLRYTPVIVLTASATAQSKLQALQLGATDFLSKPVDASELVLRVRNTLAFRQYALRLLNEDAVTGLQNRGPFDQGVEQMLARSVLVGGQVALMVIELPEARSLADTLGQQAADQFASRVARRLLRAAERDQPTIDAVTVPERTPRVARLDATRFAVAYEGVPPDQIERLARRLARELQLSVSLGLHEVHPVPWIGIAVAPADGQTAEALRRNADQAASHTQQQGSVPIGFASRELSAQLLERLSLGASLRGAGARGELRLHYQPKVDLRDGSVCGVEALLRWQHPELGLLGPNRFIPLAEELGLVHELGRWVAQQACHDAAQWAAQGFAGTRVAINVAQPQFAVGDLCAVIREAAASVGLPARSIVVELTESMLMHDVGAAIAMMQALKELGVALSVDDFGTGYSSLGYLKRFPLDELKIDRAFVMDLPGTARDQAIVRSVVDLGHHLGLVVTAEGVETAEQRKCLLAMGCDQMQGYLYSRPLPLESLLALLRRSATSATARARPGGP